MGAEQTDSDVTISNLGSLYNDQKKYEQVESLYERIVAILEQQLGNKIPNIIAMLNTNVALLDTEYMFNLADVLDNITLLVEDVRAYEQAEELHQQNLSIYEQELGSENPDTVTTLKNRESMNRPRGSTLYLVYS